MNSTVQNKKILAILGGSFNPPHLGHLRLAIEVLQTLQPARLDLLPVARPAHKKGSGLLPFELRCKLLDSFSKADPRISINQLENKRSGKSYTYETLQIYRELEPDFEPVFILGGEDFAALQSWEGWTELPDLAHLLIISRGEYGAELFKEDTLKFWTNAKAIELKQHHSILGSGNSRLWQKAQAAFKTPKGGEIWQLPLARLDISATNIRKAWLNNENLNALIQDEAIKILWQNAHTVRSTWAQG